MEITVLTEKDMQKLFTMEEAIAVSKEAARLYSTGEKDIPLRANLNVEKYKGQSLYMYGYVPEVPALGVKIVSVYPENINKGLPSVPATMVLVNAETGELCALLDGNFLTRIRTGAISGAATDLLARKESSVFALFGTGGQALSQLEAVLAVRPIKEVRVFDLDKERAEAFIRTAQGMPWESKGISYKVATSSKEAVEGADIITTVTTAPKAVFDGTLVKVGAHINGVGSYTPNMAEIDEYIITHSKVYVDTRAGALAESGDLLQPIEKGVFGPEAVLGELGEVVAGKAVARETNTEITFFETTGNAIFDLVTAQKIYAKAQSLGMGTKIKM